MEKKKTNDEKENKMRKRKLMEKKKTKIGRTDEQTNTQL